MSCAVIFRQPYYDEYEMYYDAETICVIVQGSDETELIFAARVQAHVDIMNQYYNQEIELDWEVAPIVIDKL